MTECSPVISTNLPWNSKKGSVGKLLPNCEAKTVNEDGFVFLTGRKKNLIITPNGENVSPEEIENKLSEKRIIQEVLVRDFDVIAENQENLMLNRKRCSKISLKNVYGRRERYGVV